MNLFQRTIRNSTQVTGIGIHSGRRVTMSLHPAPSHSGIHFKRVDIKNSPIMKATALTVGTTENATTLGEGAGAIHTVEHILSALYGLGINNVYIEIDAPEVPIMDGSAASFIFLLKEVGIIQQTASKKFMMINKKIRVEKDDKWATIEPWSHLAVDSTIVFAHPVIKTQRYQLNFSCEEYIKQVSRARTFGFLKDVDMLKRKGLARGGSLDNAIVLDDYHVMNPEGLRYPDEFIRHKILDTIGDMSLLGHELIGKITTYKSGHNLHNILCREILAQENYDILGESQLPEEMKKTLDLRHAMSVF